MSMIDAIPLLAGAGADGGYQISRSVRLRSSASAYFNRTPASTGSQTTWTWSGWFKRGTITSTAQTVLFCGQAATPAKDNWTKIVIGGTDTLIVGTRVSAVDQFNLATTQVFRDPSSWYHIVVAVDTTQGTASSRVKIYVNGVQVTSFSTATYPSLNYAVPYVNVSGQSNFIGRYLDNAYEYLDGYVTEINFIDGQALTPNSFGTINSYGVWQPITYGGSYGTNGFYLPFTSNSSTYAGGFNGSSQYLLTSTNASLALGTNSFTIEYWLYINSNVGGTTAVSSGNGTTTYDGLFGHQTGSQSLILYLSSTGSSWDIANGVAIGSTPTGTWNHVAITRNGNTFYTFVNGVQGATFSSSASIYQSANSISIGRAQSGTPINGNVSNLRVVVGTALYTSNFTIPTSNLTAVTNTKLLTLQNATIVDNSTNALTFTNTGSVVTGLTYPFSAAKIFSDQSPQGNNWTPNNVSGAFGTTLDYMTDVPTLTSATAANYCVLNPLSLASSTTLSEANLKGVSSTFNNLQSGTVAVSSGKWYWELTFGGSLGMVGIVPASAPPTTDLGYTATSYGYRSSTGTKYNNGSATAYGNTYTTNDVIGVALDLDNGKLFFSKNNTWQNSGDPAAGTNAAFTGLSGSFMPAAGTPDTTAATWYWNFGQRPFTYTPPTGFLALNTQNLPTPTISNGATVMAATLYTGNDPSTQTITNTVNGVSFQPDLVWVKSRSNAYTHVLVDSVRGVSTALFSNLTNAEVTEATRYVYAFNSNGFSVKENISTGSVNATAGTYVGWQWNAGGSTVTNTSGSISSQVRANPTAGFSIVTCTFGNGSIGHGLGVAPKMIIGKGRGPTTGNWIVFHSGLANMTDKYLNLNGTAAVGTLGTAVSAPTSTLFYGNGGYLPNAESAIFYCWAAVAGYSAFGSYTGNGSADGPFAFCGFRPRFVMIKNISAAGEWVMWDTSRSPYNYVGPFLYANTSAAEGASAEYLDILSNGFKLRTTNATLNTNGQVSIFIAFAESPFKLALAR